MRSGLPGLFAALALLSVTGCDWDQPVAPDGQAFRSVQSGNTLTAPSNVTTTATSHSEIQVAWTDNSSNESGFEVHNSSTGANGTFYHFLTTGPGVTSRVQSGLPASTEYCYKVRAFMIKGRKTTYSAFSNTSCATTRPLPLPNAPSDVNVTPVSRSAVNITWTAPADGQSGFRIERAGSPEGPWTILMTAITTIRSYEDSGLSGDATVCYRVTAFNDYGFSQPSGVDCTGTVLAPTDLSAVAIGPNTVALGWTDNSAVEDGYEVRRAGTDGSWSVVARLSANAIGHQDGGLTADARYVYAVFARRDGGHSSSSNEVAVTTASAGVPAAPAHLNVMPGNSSSVTIAWSASSTDADSYRVERSIDGQISWSTVAIVTPDVTQVDDPGRQTELQVCYRVIAANGTTSRESVPSIVDCTTPPAAPTNFVFGGYTDWGWYISRNVSWTDNSSAEDGHLLWIVYSECNAYDADGYCVEYLPYYYAISIPANVTSWEIFESETVYGLVATKDGGQSDWLFPSATASARMSANRAEQVKRGAKKGPPRPGVTPTRVRPDLVRSEKSSSRR